MAIYPEMKMADLLEQYPETLPVFGTNGFAAETIGQLLESVGPELMLQTVLKAKRINQTLFLQMLEEQMKQAAESRPLIATELPYEGHLNLLSYVVCPLKHLFKEGLETAVQQYRSRTGQTLNAYMPMGCGGVDPCENIWKVASIDDFPDLVVSIGFDNLFKAEFMARYVKAGCFTAVQPGPVAANLAELVDPDGWHTLYGIFPYIMLIDRQKLGDLPLPRRWSDLMDPVYQGQIVIGGSWDEPAEILLLEIYKEFGKPGVERLARNVKDAWHASKMAKMAGSGHPDGVAIYVIPWFFAESCAHKEVAEIYWPEDGALVNPMYMLVKTAKVEALQSIADYVTGVELGQKAAATFFPVLNPAVENGLPPGATFKWLGWNYIKSVDILGMVELTRGIFQLNCPNKG